VTNAGAGARAIALSILCCACGVASMLGVAPARAQTRPEIPTPASRELRRNPVGHPSPPPDPSLAPKHYRLWFEVGVHSGHRVPDYVTVAISPELGAEWRALPELAVTFGWGGMFFDDAIGGAVVAGNPALGASYVLDTPDGLVSFRAGAEIIGPLASADSDAEELAYVYALAMRALFDAWRFTPDVMAIAPAVSIDARLASAPLRVRAGIAAAPLLCIDQSSCSERGDDEVEIALQASASASLVIADDRLDTGVRLGTAVLTAGQATEGAQVSVTPFVTVAIAKRAWATARFVLGLDEPFGVVAGVPIWAAFVGATADLDSW